MKVRVSSHSTLTCIILASLLVLVLSAVVAVPNSVRAEESNDKVEEAHQQWLLDRLRDAKSIKPGMSRTQLLELFEEEGGFDTDPPLRYVLKRCPVMHIDVQFMTVDERHAKKHPATADDLLQIATVSDVYLVNLRRD
jgi:poly-D-alanine transfer protein DltD